MCWQRTLRVEALLQILHAKRFYSEINIQMQFIKIHKVKSSKYYLPLCRCVNRDLWELKLYCKYYNQKGFILEWVFECHSSKSTKWNLHTMSGHYFFLCGCVDRDLWELKLYCKYYTQKGFILEWIYKCHLSKSSMWNLQGMIGLSVNVLTKNFESWSFIANITLKKVLF